MLCPRSVLQTEFSFHHARQARHPAANLWASAAGGPQGTRIAANLERTLAVPPRQRRGDANGSWRAALQPRQMRPLARVSRTHLCLCRGETALYKQSKTNQAFEFEHLPLTLRRRAGGGWTPCDSRAQGDGNTPTRENKVDI